jgi:hypothetical protein
MSPIIFFAAGLALAVLDLLGLWAFVRSLMGNPRPWLKALLFVFVIGKFGVLAVCIRWLSRQNGFNSKALLLGLLLPFVFFMAFELKRQFLRSNHG